MKNNKILKFHVLKELVQEKNNCPQRGLPIFISEEVFCFQQFSYKPLYCRGLSAKIIKNIRALPKGS